MVGSVMTYDVWHSNLIYAFTSIALICPNRKNLKYFIYTNRNDKFISKNFHRKSKNLFLNVFNLKKIKTTYPVYSHPSL